MGVCTEDEKEKASAFIARYPCMPSLAGIQQMRNRLHLAHAGKKLMSHTAHSTSCELKILAGEITEACQCFCEEVCLSYILLARARYTNPYLHDMVLNNLPTEPRIDGYAHLGIGRGGETVRLVKRHWNEMLQKMIHMCRLKCCFKRLDKENRGACKSDHKNSQQETELGATEAIHYINKLQEINLLSESKEFMSYRCWTAEFLEDIKDDLDGQSRTEISNLNTQSPKKIGYSNGQLLKENIGLEGRLYKGVGNLYDQLDNGIDDLVTQSHSKVDDLSYQLQSGIGVSDSDQLMPKIGDYGNQCPEILKQSSIKHLEVILKNDKSLSLCISNICRRALHKIYRIISFFKSTKNKSITSRSHIVE